jgi:holo-[acyl-carrier protein] synthase
VTVSCGVDLVAVDAFARLLAREGPRFADAVFTADEQAACSGQAERLASRFAAKEAVLKALGVGVDRVRLSDIEVRNAASGRPAVQLHGEAAALAAQANLRDFSLSLSHDGGMAAAMVVAT